MLSRQPYGYCRRGCLMTAASRTMRKGTWLNTVGVYVALTKFVRDKFIEAGFPEQKTGCPKTTLSIRIRGVATEKAIMHANSSSRLSPEKGLDTFTATGLENN